MARLRSETIINLLGRASEFIGRSWMKTSVLRGFLPEGDRMRAGNRLSSGSHRGHVPLSRDLIRDWASAASKNRRQVTKAKKNHVRPIPGRRPDCGETLLPFC